MLKAGAELMTCTSEQHSSAAGGDTCGGGGLRHGQVVHLTQGEKGAQALRQALQAAPHPGEHVGAGGGFFG